MISMFSTRINISKVICMKDVWHESQTSVEVYPIDYVTEALNPPVFKSFERVIRARKREIARGCGVVVSNERAKDQGSVK